MTNTQPITDEVTNQATSGWQSRAELLMVYYCRETLMQIPGGHKWISFPFFLWPLVLQLKKNKKNRGEERKRKERKGKKKGWPIRLANYSSGPYLTCTGPYHDDCARNFPCPLPSPLSEIKKKKAHNFAHYPIMEQLERAITSSQRWQRGGFDRGWACREDIFFNLIETWREGAQEGV